MYSVAVQLKTLMAEGTATRKLRNEKTMPAYTDWPADEHVVAPDEEAEDGDRQLAQAMKRVAEDRLAAEAGDDLADHAHRRAGS